MLIIYQFSQYSLSLAKLWL